MPPKKPSGTEMTRAQGQLMTRKVSAFSTQPAQPGSRPSASLIAGGSRASSSAAAQTAGV